MKFSKVILPVVFACAAAMPLTISAQEATPSKSLDELLKKVEAGRVKEAREHRAREKKFASNKNEQARMLKDIQQQQRNQEAKSTRLEADFEENDKKLAEAEKRLAERMGTLGELFGHLTSTAGDARSNFEGSLVSLNYPDRDKFLNELVEVTSSGTELPSIEQIEQLWFELQREMTEQGKVAKFKANVADAAGNTVEQDVVRIGVFNAVSDSGKYLKYENGSLAELDRQPSGKYLNAAAELASGNAGIVKMGIDPTGPTGGSLLKALIQAPDLEERWHQGGIVGYVITAVGAIAILLAIWRLIVLSMVGGKVNRQLKNTTPNDDNPLGRVLAVEANNKGLDLETLELKLEEAIIKELPKLQKFESILKIISAIAPLLGLLGTVTGMILTFQAITIYGAGDPKAMAGGISSALITTVLGLIVAIPTVLMHTIVSGRSKRIIHILEEQAAGIAATHQEARQ